jgi:hypothetical protein
MRAQDFWKAVTVDRANLLVDVLSVLRTADARFCVIGGVAVNAYVEPVVTLDVDIVIAVADQPTVEAALARDFTVERFPHSVNVSAPDSDLRVQVQLDPRYASFVDRAEPRAVLGLTLPVASIEDVLQGKLWAVQDPARRASKRQKDLADIARLLEHEPRLRGQVPAEVLARLYPAGE